MVARINESAPRKAGPGLPVWVRRLGLLRESPVGMAGAGLVIFWVLVAAFAPLLAPYNPNANDFMVRGNWLPSAAHWLGTDNQARDILSRVIWGSRTVLTVAPIAVACAYLVGCLMGLLAGYYRGWVDALVSRISDIILSFPVIILYMIIIANFGPSAFNIIVAVTFTAAPQITRIVRGLTLELRERDYVAAAKMRGESALYIMLVEILPNARGPLIVDACLRMGYTTIAIGVLGFLGLGLPPPDPDWGGMVRETYVWVSTYPHMPIIPCLAISSLVVGFNLLSDGIREIGLRD
ncbi:peptide ABC transporter substrate-binding protein [Hypericibacter adhaerens]|jgi:peptide/nickel transport system permease protein|uniref:Peptide ABC transporter substrate-binding protein n=1 Tax=Hypericibacter adhaerens TaxID=2602016 RepID=A0A5J6N0H7_9PROT|nr:ABC transporter permease [Hypericibacter adhaerens]QEX22445.1 peptide ABC transporter substrate-binding protein [Hypericibacter adhaerens]